MFVADCEQNDLLRLMMHIVTLEAKMMLFRKFYKTSFHVVILKRKGIEGSIATLRHRELLPGKEIPSTLCCLDMFVLGSGALKTQKSLICAILLPKLCQAASVEKKHFRHLKFVRN